MPNTPHIEKHFTGSEFVRDVVIGMSDGLTVPFALAAGLSGAVSATRLVVVAGLAEIAAGAIAMGLGGYLAAKNDAEHYAHERAREEREIVELPDEETREVERIFQGYGLKAEETRSVVNALAARPKDWVDFMMRFELGLEQPAPQRAHRSAMTIGGAYITGGLVPLIPYMLLPRSADALVASVVLTLAALTAFGYAKGRFTGSRPIESALRTAFIGGLAAAAAFAIARLIGRE
jgi:vacuolar iron transporter family protein